MYIKDRVTHSQLNKYWILGSESDPALNILYILKRKQYLVDKNSYKLPTNWKGAVTKGLPLQFVMFRSYRRTIEAFV